MSTLMLILCVVGYFVIGAVVAGLLFRWGLYEKKELFWCMLFWPLTSVITAIVFFEIWIIDLISGGKL